MSWKGFGRSDWDNVIGIATVYGLDAPAFESRWGQEILSFA